MAEAAARTIVAHSAELPSMPMARRPAKCNDGIPGLRRTRQGPGRGSTGPPRRAARMITAVRSKLAYRAVDATAGAMLMSRV